AGRTTELTSVWPGAETPVHATGVRRRDSRHRCDRAVHGARDRGRVARAHVAAALLALARRQRNLARNARGTTSRAAVPAPECQRLQFAAGLAVAPISRTRPEVTCDAP